MFVLLVHLMLALQSVVDATSFVLSPTSISGSSLSSTTLSSSFFHFHRPLQQHQQGRLDNANSRLCKKTRMILSMIRGGSSSGDDRATTVATVNPNEESTQSYYNASAVDVASMSMNELYELLQTPSNAAGLTSEEAQRRLEMYGPNVLPKPPKKTILTLILEQFQDRLVQILLMVAIVSAIFSVAEVLSSSSSSSVEEELWRYFVEPAVILAILVGNASIGVWQTRSASDALAALEQMQAATATAIRGGNPGTTIPAGTLVPGDVIEVRVGDKVPADARLISISSSVLAVDEGSLTGESTTVFKIPGDEGRSESDALIAEKRGMLFSGTCITQGSGKAVITATGIHTEFGIVQQGVLSAKSEQPNIKTPLAIRLDEFGETLTVIIGVICLAVWIVSIPKMNDPTFANFWEGAIYYAKVAVALGVAAIPEGLPAVITLCLSLGTRRMAARNVIVRNLPSVETLGCTSVICTDKTGTLTTNEVRNRLRSRNIKIVRCS
jgi:Ca2+-transporting ATPase